jgi:tagaturonate epimerase
LSELPTVDLAQLRRASRLAANYPASFVQVGHVSLWLERGDEGKRLAVLAPADDPIHERFGGVASGEVLGRSLVLAPLNAANAAAIREVVDSLQPVPLGLRTSAGFGDRLGLATPGHVRALRRVSKATGHHSVAPIFAQQSIREMERTGRSALDVLDDATWGAFQAGWHGPLGADADHLKTLNDIDQTAACGYSFYTIDPGAFVDGGADTATPEAVQRALETLPWDELETDLADLRRRYTAQPVKLDDRTIAIDDEALARAVVKYGRAIAHVRRMYRHLLTKDIPFELEMSVDETETPTSLAEHIYIASELQRLGVRWVSLAPRFVGSFEKGVDYIGDLAELRTDLEGHAAIARSLGPYKLSLHSGSDKFQVYPLIQEATNGLVHLKTAGTSYLEALRVTAQVDPSFFREILAFAREHYDRDRATYHVSADVARVPGPAAWRDEDLPKLLDDFDARQVLHVTFGSTLAAFRPRLMDLLVANEDAYDGALERHFVRHLAPFAQRPQAAPVEAK